MKHFTSVILFAVISFLSHVNFAQLSYSEGGPSVEDPGLEVDIELRRYVDINSGSDANDGKSQATAWKSLSKVSSERGSFIPGFHILFKRGQSWTGDLGSDNWPRGEENNRIVFGAYGSLSDAPPKISKTIKISTYWMLRDMQASRLYMGNYGNHHSIIYNNICFGGGANGISVIGNFHHSTIIGNIVYDVDNNDALLIHSRNWVTPKENVKSHHWIIDNITIGNSGMEDGIDAAMGDYTNEGQPVEGDVKVIANRVQMESVPGLSKRSGTGNQIITMGHEAYYTWVIGNIGSSGASRGVHFSSDRDNIKASGNIFIKGGVANMCVLKAPSLEFYNNTVYDYSGESTPIILNSENSVVFNNIILRPEGGYWVQKRTTPFAMDYNWYGHSDSPVIDGTSLSDWQTTTGFDINSESGTVAGLTEPATSAYNHDPRNWNNQDFLNHFIPSSEFTGIDGIIPGAYDTKGQRQGMAILPFEESDLENGGLGWEGPPIVQQRLKELGISWGEPLLAKYPSPKDKSKNVSIDSELSWESGDSSISHNIYLGTKLDSLIFVTSENGLSYTPSTFAYETNYYWRVDEVTSDSIITGSVWSFTTEEEPIPPTVAETPVPFVGASEVRTNTLLKWKAGKRTRSFKIYFGSSNPPQLVSSQDEESYTVSGLELNTKYYWRVDGVNEWGETEGTVWDFTTESVASLPSGWASLDIGNTSIIGTDIFEDDDKFSVAASGKGMVETSDQFRFVYHSLNGDGEIIAQVSAIDNSTSSTIAGVMVRETLDSNSAHHMVGITSEQGVEANWRLFVGGQTNTKNGKSVSTPYWVKLIRASDFILSSESSDGKTWKTVKTEKIKMQSNVYMGLVVSSRNNDSLGTAIFDKVSINGTLVSVEDEEESLELVPQEFAISNYPNPFNPSTTIKYSIPNIEGNENFRSVQIEVYDIIGSLIKELVREKKKAGSYRVVWNGRNNQDLQVASGIYFYKVQLDEQVKTAKMLLMK